jgi:hypothetical protein
MRMTGFWKFDADTKPRMWRQHVAEDVSPQINGQFKIKPRSGDTKFR